MRAITSFVLKIAQSQRPAKFRRGSNTVITPFQTQRVDLKIDEDRGKIKERSREDCGKIEKRSRKIEADRGNCVFFSEPFLGNSRDAGVFRNFCWVLPKDYCKEDPCNFP